MRYKTYNKRTNANVLKELMDATGRGALEFDVSPDNTTIVGFPDDVPVSAIDAVVNAHNPLIYEQAENRRRQNRVLDIQTIRNFAKSTTAPTPDQELAFLKAVARDHLRVLGALRDEDDA